MKPIDVAYLSFTAQKPGEHALRSEWHQIDHMPEQYAIPGIAWGQRYVSPPSCIDARLAQVGLLSEVEFLIVYFMHEPIDETLADFGALADDLRAQGRMFDSEGKLRGAFTIGERHASPRALVRPEVVPYRPHRGIYVTLSSQPMAIERDRVLATPGVAGYWTMAVDPAHHASYSTPGRYYAAMVYLDEPVLGVTAELNRLFGPAAPSLLFAGPFVVTTFFAWDQYERNDVP